MNAYDKSVEIGRAIIRGKGINFTKFKTELQAAVRFSWRVDEDSYVDWYNTFAWWNSTLKQSYDVASWAKEFFQESDDIKFR